MSDTTPDISPEQEEWRVIPGLIYSGFYEASSLGRIKDNVSGDITSGALGKYFKYYTYRIPHVRKTFFVHRMVALAFLGVCPPGIVVNHKDLNKLNNRISNLEYVTESRNAQHAKEHYLNITPDTQQRYKAIIRLRAAGWSYEDIGYQFSLTKHQVRAIIQASGLQTEGGNAGVIYINKPIKRSVFDTDDN